MPDPGTPGSCSVHHEGGPGAHDADHHHPLVDRTRSRHRLLWALCLTAAYMVCEAVGGWLANSLALLADAGHMLADVAALALSLFALWIAGRPASSRRTFGYYRMEILAALANGLTLIAIAVVTLAEAWSRLKAPPLVDGAVVMAIAAGGTVVNLLALGLLHQARTESLNVHGAWLHVLTDTLGSVAAVIAGGLVWGFGWTLADPVTSAFIALLIVYSAWGLMTETVSILLESAPSRLDVDAVRDAIAGIPGVTAVHELHIWTISSGLESLSAHVEARNDHPPQEVLAGVRGVLSRQFGLEHTTIQIEEVTCSGPGCRF